MPLPLIHQIYIICASIGSIVLVLCAVFGAHHGGSGGAHSGGHVGAGGHSGIGHSGAGGHAGIGHSGAGGNAAIGHSGMGGNAAIGHSGAAGAPGIGHSGAGGVGHSGAGGAGHLGAGGAGHSGASGVGHSGAGGTGHSGAGGTGHSGAGDVSHSGTGAGAHGGTSGGAQSASGTNAGINEMIKIQANTGPFHAPTREEQKSGPLEVVLGVINPTIITTFLAFFGLTGLFFISTFPILGWVSLAPAFVGGLVAVKVVTNVMNAFLSRTFSSSAATEHDLIGHMAEVSVPITVGRTGEVTYIIASKRLTSPARAKSPDMEIKKGTKVFICDHLEKYVLVDLWTDNFLDPYDDQTLTNEEKLARLRSQQLQ